MVEIVNGTRKNDYFVIFVQLGRAGCGRSSAGLLGDYGSCILSCVNFY